MRKQGGHYLIYQDPQKSEIKNPALAASREANARKYLEKLPHEMWDTKIDVSGNVVQVRHYSVLQALHRRSCRAYDIHPDSMDGETAMSERMVSSQCETDDDGNVPATSMGRDAESARRARSIIARVVSSNFGNIRRGFVKGRSVKFLTLTYAENMQERARLYTDYIKMIDALEYRLEEKVQYLAVPERQKRGAYHAHCILLCSYIPLKVMKEIWSKDIGRGSFDLQKARGADNCGAYLAKYISKDVDTELPDGQGRRRGEHRYWKSNGLKDRTYTLKVMGDKCNLGIDRVKELVADGVVKYRYARYNGEYVGDVTFAEFILSRRYSLGLCQVLGDMSRGQNARERDIRAMYRYRRDTAR